jgi:hypothetical protein
LKLRLMPESAQKSIASATLTASVQRAVRW